MYSLQCILIAKVFWDLVEGGGISKLHGNSILSPLGILLYSLFWLWFAKNLTKLRAGCEFLSMLSRVKQQKGKGGKLGLQPFIINLPITFLSSSQIISWNGISLFPNLYFSSIFKNLCLVEKEFRFKYLKTKHNNLNHMMERLCRIKNIPMKTE